MSARLDFDALPPVRPASTLGAEWMVAWAHLRSKRVDAALSVVTMLAIFGVLLSVAAMNVVMAVMEGFSTDLRDKILGANAHVVVFRHGGSLLAPEEVVQQVEAVPGVDAAAPFIFSELMIRSSASHTGVVVKGIDPDRSSRVLHLLGDLTVGPEGELSSLEERSALLSRLDEPFHAIGLDGEPLITEKEPELPGIILGEELADQLLVRPGDKIQLINPIGGGIGPMGLPTPTVRAMRVAALFKSGMYEYDTKWTYVHLGFSQDFMNLGDAVSAIEVRLTDFERADAMSRAIESELKFPFYARHWKELNANLFEALALERWVARLLFTIVVAIAGSLIVSTLLMVVLTKGKEIAILKAMGASPLAVLRIFLMEGAAIGLVGSSVGTVLGLLACWVLHTYPIPIDTDVYLMSKVPVVIYPLTVVGIALSAFGMCFVLTLYPAWRASQLDPVEALRYE